LRDKDWRGILHALSSVASRIVLTNAPTAPANRVWPLAEVVAWATAQELPIVVAEDFDTALHRASDGAGTVLVTGSFHTVGDAMDRLQVDPLAR